MRETKFRYQFKHRKTGEKLKTVLSIAEIEQQTFAIFKDLLNWEILSRDECTGRKDNNRVEIFEGDIVKTYGVIGFVEFVDGSFVVNRQNYIKKHGTAPWIEWPSQFFEDCEIIGNIWENPDWKEQ